MEGSKSNADHSSRPGDMAPRRLSSCGDTLVVVSGHLPASRDRIAMTSAGRVGPPTVPIARPTSTGRRRVRTKVASGPTRLAQSVRSFRGPHRMVPVGRENGAGTRPEGRQTRVGTIESTAHHERDPPAITIDPARQTTAAMDHFVPDRSGSRSRPGALAAALFWCAYLDSRPRSRPGSKRRSASRHRPMTSRSRCTVNDSSCATCA